MVHLDGRRVRLREFRLDDLDRLPAVVADDRVTRWMAFDSMNHERQAEWLAAQIERAAADPRTEYLLAVTPPADDDLVGFVRLALGGELAGQLGYAIAADRWGHGFATDAAHTMIGFGFGTLGLHRITAAIGPENSASVAVVRRLGFSREGRLRDHVRANGAWRDSELYSLLAHEWCAPA